VNKSESINRTNAEFLVKKVAIWNQEEEVKRGLPRHFIMLLCSPWATWVTAPKALVHMRLAVSLAARRERWQKAQDAVVHFHVNWSGGVANFWRRRNGERSHPAAPRARATRKQPKNNWWVYIYIHATLFNTPNLQCNYLRKLCHTKELMREDEMQSAGERGIETYSNKPVLKMPQIKRVAIRTFQNLNCCLIWSHFMYTKSISASQYPCWTIGASS